MNWIYNNTERLTLMAIIVVVVYFAYHITASAAPLWLKIAADAIFAFVALACLDAFLSLSSKDREDRQ
jgi:hypothetical protein